MLLPPAVSSSPDHVYAADRFPREITSSAPLLRSVQIAAGPAGSPREITPSRCLLPPWIVPPPPNAVFSIQLEVDASVLPTVPPLLTEPVGLRPSDPAADHHPHPPFPLRLLFRPDQHNNHLPFEITRHRSPSFPCRRLPWITGLLLRPERHLLHPEPAAATFFHNARCRSPPASRRITLVDAASLPVLVRSRRSCQFSPTRRPPPVPLYAGLRLFPRRRRSPLLLRRNPPAIGSCSPNPACCRRSPHCRSSPPATSPSGSHN